MNTPVDVCERMSWLDLLAYYDEAMALERARSNRIQRVMMMVPKKGGRGG